MQLPLFGKLYLLKLASKHVFLSMSFDCFLSACRRLYRKPAWCVLFSYSWLFGLEWMAQRRTLFWIWPSSVPGHDYQTQQQLWNQLSSNLSWMEWLHCLEFQFWPSSLPHSVLGSFLFKTYSHQNCFKTNKSLEIARKHWEHPLARGKAGIRGDITSGLYQK